MYDTKSTLAAGAERALGQLLGLARLLEGHLVLTEPFRKREAAASCRLDGVTASLTDLVFYEAAGEPGTDRSDVRELRNYAAVLSLDAPLDLPGIHEMLFAGVRAPSQTPPPAVAGAATLEELAVGHHRLEGHLAAGPARRTIRAATARAQPMLYLAPYLADRAPEYRERVNGDEGSWTDFFLRAVIAQSDDTFVRIQRLLGIAETYRERTRSARNSAALEGVIDRLLGLPVTTAANLAAATGVTYPAAKKTVDRLVEFGVLTPQDVGARHFYVAKEVLEVLDPAQ